MSVHFPGIEKFPKLKSILETIKKQTWFNPPSMFDLLIELTSICADAAAIKDYSSQTEQYAKIAGDFERENIELKNRSKTIASELSAMQYHFRNMEKKYNSKVQVHLEESLAVSELKQRISDLELENKKYRTANIAYADENESLGTALTNLRRVNGLGVNLKDEKDKSFCEGYEKATLKMNEALKLRSREIEKLEKSIKDIIELYDYQEKVFSEKIADLECRLLGLRDLHGEAYVSRAQRTRPLYSSQDFSSSVKSATTPGPGPDMYANQNQVIENLYKTIDQQKQDIRLLESSLSDWNKWHNKQGLNAGENCCDASVQPLKELIYNYQKVFDQQNKTIQSLRDQLKHKETYAADTEKYADGLKKELFEAKELVLKHVNGNITLHCMYNLLKKHFVIL